ncbi:MAG: ACT domain-containing protein [Pseudomonadota bacterium]
MSNWKMLTLVGKDQQGIVAQITEALYSTGAQLGKASMMRLGGNFTIMLMLNSDQNIELLCKAVKPIVDKLALTYHFQEIEVDIHDHQIPNTRISVYGADRPGIVAKVTAALNQGGFNILDLESDVAGQDKDSLYIMHIEGTSEQSPENIETDIKLQLNADIQIDVSAIDTMIG